MQIFTYSSSQIINFLQDIGRSKADETASLHNTSFVGIYQRKRCMMTLQTFICTFQGGISIVFASGFKIEFEYNTQLNLKLFSTFQIKKKNVYILRGQHIYYIHSKTHLLRTQIWRILGYSEVLF